MAVQLECINLIIPIKTIEKKYAGGWKQFLAEREPLIGAWYDDYLFRTGAMNQMDIYFLLEHSRKMGFETHTETPVFKWLDVCVVNPSNLACDWLEVENDTAFLKGKPKGKVIGSGMNCEK